MSVLEHPRQHAERRGQGQGAEDQRPDRLHHAAGEQEQDDERGQHHQADRQREAASESVDGVDELRILAPAADKFLGRPA